MGRPAVFLDRDGTIVREVEYLRSPKELRLLPRAGEAIRRLNEAGFAVARRSARVDAISWCPHHPEASRPEYRRRCRCRKPSPGMLLRAARELDLDLARSYAVGDSERDVDAGRRAGCRTVLVRTGYGAEAEARLGAGLPADHVADDLSGAVEWILGDRRRRGRVRRSPESR